MNTSSVLNKNLSDLNMALNLASSYNNKALKNYVNNRINTINRNHDIYEYLSPKNVVDSYVIDLQLFIKVSDVIHDIDSKDFYKSRLIDIIKKFDYLKNRKDLVNLI